VVSQAVVIATGVAADGHREVLGFAVGDSEDGAFWTAFPRTLKARGLAGTQLPVEDCVAMCTGLDRFQHDGAATSCRSWNRGRLLETTPAGRRSTSTGTPRRNCRPIPSG
jgi:hypothetical protein